MKHHLQTMPIPSVGVLTRTKTKSFSFYEARYIPRNLYLFIFIFIYVLEEASSSKTFAHNF